MVALLKEVLRDPSCFYLITLPCIAYIAEVTLQTQIASLVSVIICILASRKEKGMKKRRAERVNSQLCLRKFLEAAIGNFIQILLSRSQVHGHTYDETVKCILHSDGMCPVRIGGFCYCGRFSVCFILSPLLLFP